MTEESYQELLKYCRCRQNLKDPFYSEFKKRKDAAIAIKREIARQKRDVKDYTRTLEQCKKPDAIEKWTAIVKETIENLNKLKQQFIEL